MKPCVVIYQGPMKKDSPPAEPLVLIGISDVWMLMVNPRTRRLTSANASGARFYEFLGYDGVKVMLQKAEEHGASALKKI